MYEELCRDVAFEAAQRSTAVNPHELWAVLEDVNALAPRLVLDLWSEPVVHWCWWSLGARVIAAAPAPWHRVNPDGSCLLSGVTELVGDPKDAGFRQRLVDQCAGQAVDMVVLGGPNGEEGVRLDWQNYSSLVRPGGLVLVHGIGNPRFPGIRAFWAGLSADTSEYVGGFSPDGYGLVRMHGRDRLSHG